MKVYFAFALTHSPLEYREMMSRVRNNFIGKYEVLEFFSNPTDMGFDQQSLEYCQSIYDWDINCVKQADIVVAEVSQNSIGIGMELATAIWHDKYILALANKKTKVSRIVKGINYSKFRYKNYSSEKELINIINSELRTLN